MFYHFPLIELGYPGFPALSRFSLQFPFYPGNIRQNHGVWWNFSQYWKNGFNLPPIFGLRFVEFRSLKSNDYTSFRTLNWRSNPTWAILLCRSPHNASFESCFDTLVFWFLWLWQNTKGFFTLTVCASLITMDIAEGYGSFCSVVCIRLYHPTKAPL